MSRGYITRIDRIEALVGNRRVGSDWIKQEVRLGLTPRFVLNALIRAQRGQSLNHETYRKLGKVFNKPPSFFFELKGNGGAKEKTPPKETA